MTEARVEQQMHGERLENGVVRQAGSDTCVGRFPGEEPLGRAPDGRAPVDHDQHAADHHVRRPRKAKRGAGHLRAAAEARLPASGT